MECKVKKRKNKRNVKESGRKENIKRKRDNKRNVKVREGNVKRKRERMR